MKTIKKILEDMHPEFDYVNSANFIEDGYLDSFDIVSLISELEDTFSISIDGMQIIPENFITFDSIMALVNLSRK